MIEISEEDFNRFDPDAERVKDSPCSVCGRKSIARIRQYREDGFYLFAVCPDHVGSLKEILDGAKQ